MDNSVIVVCGENMVVFFIGNQLVVFQGNFVNFIIFLDSEFEFFEDLEFMEYVFLVVFIWDGCKDIFTVVFVEDVMQVEIEMFSVVIDKDCCMINFENFIREDFGLLVDFFYTSFDYGMIST